MIRIYTAANLPEAHLLVHLLDERGIAARVLNENAQGGVGELPFTHAYPEIWIDDEADARRARDVVAEFERVPGGERAGRCSACGEQCPSTFEICWNCGEPLPGEDSAI